MTDGNTSDCGSTTCYSLQIVLTNTSTTPAGKTGQVVDGLFFDLQTGGANIDTPTGMLSATATNGILTSTGSTIVSGSAGTDICGAGAVDSGKNPLCTTVGNGWESAYSTTGFTVGGTAYKENYGIGDAGWGVFNGGDVGNPTNGIVPGNGVGISSSPNGGFTNKYPYAYGTATFVLYGLKSENVTIANVKATYGTGPDAAEPAGVPEPGGASLVLLAGVYLGGLQFLRKRRQNRR